jgi:hypothetical protein
MDVLLVNGVFHYFIGAEGNISAWIKISRSGVKGTLSSFPSFDFRYLNHK